MTGDVSGVDRASLIRDNPEGANLNTKRQVNGEATQKKSASNLQGTLAVDAKGGSFGHAFLVQASGWIEDRQNVARKRLRQVRRRMHLLQIDGPRRSRFLAQIPFIENGNAFSCREIRTVLERRGACCGNAASPSCRLLPESTLTPVGRSRSASSTAQRPLISAGNGHTPAGRPRPTSPVVRATA